MKNVDLDEVNLGAYEAMDRVHMVQCQIQDALLDHWFYLDDAPEEYKKLLEQAADCLGKCYQIAGEYWYDSINSTNIGDGK